MARRSGRGKTPERLIKLLEDAVKKSSQSAVAKDLNIGVAAVNRYLNGVGEPTQETLERLAAYFGVAVGWLRNDGITMKHGGLDFNYAQSLPPDNIRLICAVCGCEMEFYCASGYKLPDDTWSKEKEGTFSVHPCLNCSKK